MISRRSAVMATTTPCLRCLVTGLLEIISRKRQLPGPGNYFHKDFNCLLTGFMSVSLVVTKKMGYQKILRHVSYGKNGFPRTGSYRLAEKIISGRWETPGRVAHVQRFMWICAVTRKDHWCQD